MLRFYWPTFRGTFGILWTATDRYVTAIGIGAAIVTFFSPELAGLWQIDLPVLSRWWTILPLLVLFAYGFLKALQERFEGLEQKLEASNKRQAVKDLLGVAVEQGRSLRSNHKAAHTAKAPSARDWAYRTHDLIEAAFDKGEAQYFLGYEVDQGYGFVDPCLSRLQQLIVRANCLGVSPEFDPQDWINR